MWDSIPDMTLRVLSNYNNRNNLFPSPVSYGPDDAGHYTVIFHCHKYTLLTNA